MNKLPTAYLINPAAAANHRFGCMPCHWASAVGVDGVSEGIEHAAIHENEQTAVMFRQCVEVMRTVAEAGRDINDCALLLSKVGEDGWNCMVMDQMEEAGVLIRVRGMG